MKKTDLTTRIFIGLSLGILLGLVLHALPESTFRDDFLIEGALQLVGTGFIRLLMMVLVPVVFFSLVCGTASLDDVRSLGRIGSKTLAFYFTTTAIAVCIALAIGLFISPGLGVDTASITQGTSSAGERTPLIQVLLNIIPNNAFNALASGNMLQIITFAIAIGVTLSICGKRTEAVATLFSQCNELFLTLVTQIMQFAPYGVFALISRTFARLGYSAMLPLARYIIAVLIGLAIHSIFVYGGMFKIFTRLSFFKFLRKSAPIATVSFSTASSNATMPVTLDIVENKLGVSNRICSFTIPLGATINMDGTAIMQGVACIFIAQVYGIELSATSFLTIILTATLASIGTAGIPGAGAIMLSMVLASVGLPVEGVALIMGVDRIVDMFRTTINVIGDAACTVIIAKSEGALDEGVFCE